MDNDALNKIIDERIKLQLKGQAFTDRKLTDTPTDNLQAVPRKYVNLNGPTANRPRSSVMAQHYFDTSLGNGKFITWNGTGWVDALGNYV